MVIFLDDNPEFDGNEGGEPLNAVGYDDDNVRIYAN